MSKVDRLEWSRKVASINERIKGFQENPNQEHLDAAINELRSYAEAAAICGCELNTVRSRLSRARSLIARWLDVDSDTTGLARG